MKILLSKINRRVIRQIKQRFWDVEPVLSKIGFRPPKRWLESKDPFDLLPWREARKLGNLSGAPVDMLLQIRGVRQVLARERLPILLRHRGLRRLSSSSEKIAYNTIEYNIEGAKEAVDLDRPYIMFGVVGGIERVWRNRSNLDILCIGPRSEIEIFGLIGAGYNQDRIRAIDLFSYSPYVDVGDMHDIPYPDNSFDVVFLGWVLSYSTDQLRVVNEIIRVCRDRAIVVLAGDYSDDSRDRPTFKNTTTHMQSCDQLLALFGDRVGKVYFRHDPELPEVAMVMTVFEVRKPQ